MVIIEGKGIGGSMVQGKLYRLQKTVDKAYTPLAPKEEERRFREACNLLDEELASLYERALTTAGEEAAEIFSIHRMMLQEGDLADAVSERIAAGESAISAITTVGEGLSIGFASMDNAYMQARAADIQSLIERLEGLLRGEGGQLPTFTEPVILAAEDLTPAQTVALDKDKILGFVTEGGSIHSHTAILAKTLHIPAVVNTGSLPADVDGKNCVLDGDTGRVYLEPSEAMVRICKEAQAENRRRQAELRSFTDKCYVDQDGIPVKVLANAGSMADVEAAISAGAEGIGLFRSEFLFMQYDRCPTEEEQYGIYCDVLRRMNGKEVIVRLLDAGADKTLPWLPSTHEANPALGLRAIRLCLRHPEILRGQIRALYRASAHGNISAMIPLVTGMEEVHAVRTLASELCRELDAQTISHNPKMPIGIMVETPSAAILSDKLAKISDFFSIGSNDLLQYTMAADRENPEVSYLTEQLPESVCRLIEMTARAAKDVGIPVSICGELGGDTRVTHKLLSMGIRKFSVSAGRILQLKEAISKETGLIKEKMY